MDIETAALAGIEKAAQAEKAETPPVEKPTTTAKTPVELLTKPAEGEATEETTEDEDGVEAPAEEPVAPPAVEIKDDMTVKVGDQDVTIADLKGGYMRLTDYRKKTTEVARERDAIKAERAGWESERNQWKGYLQGLFNDPEFLANELEEYGAATLDKVLNAKADELIKRENMDEATRRLWDEAKQRARDLKKRERALEAEERKRKATEGKSRVDAIAQRYTRVVPAAMEAAGLVIKDDNDHNRHMARLLQGELAATHGNVEYSDEQIAEAAKAVAESPAAKALLREKRGLSTSVDELVKKLGPEKVKELLKHEAAKIVEKRPEPVVHYKPGNGKKEKQNPKVTIGSYFDNIRDQFNR